MIDKSVVEYLLGTLRYCALVVIIYVGLDLIWSWLRR